MSIRRLAGMGAALSLLLAGGLAAPVLAQSSEDAQDAGTRDDGDPSTGLDHRAGSAEVFVEAAEADRWVERNGYGSGEEDPEEDVGEDGLGWHHETHPVAGLNTGCPQSAGHSAGALLYFWPAQEGGLFSPIEEAHA